MYTIRPNTGSYEGIDVCIFKSQTRPHYLTVDNDVMSFSEELVYDEKYFWLIEQGDTDQYNMIVHAKSFKVLNK